MTNYLPALLALFALGAQAAEPAKPLAPAAKPAQPAQPAAPGAGVKYVQAASGNSLSFTFQQLDAASTGQFKTFATTLIYDEKNPAAGSLDVKVTIGSLDTQDGERDEALKSADLFDAAKIPTATYIARSLARNASGGLEAVGKLTLRGVSKDLRLPLTIKPTANGLELSGQTAIKRLDYGVGQGEWKSTESVGDEVKIQYKVALVRAK
jgi:polyisoprenoid-binding protein YceI